MSWEEDFPDDELMMDKTKVLGNGKKNEKPEQIEMKVEKEETKKHDPATPSEDKSETEKNVKVGKLADLEKSPKIKGPQAISPPNKSLKESFIDPSQMAETKKGSDDVVHEVEARVDEEMQRLLKDIRRVGEAGKPEVTFGELFVDPEVEQYYVALVGTLKSAKKRGLIYFEGQMLLKGPSDNILISIVNQWDDTI